MSKPSKALRQQRILVELGQAPSLRVAELARMLEVSTETIRRDLDEMTGQGLLNRTYGGAIRPEVGEPALSIRQSFFVEERTRIAQAAIPLLRDARVVMLGSGSTTMHLARRIALEMRDITVITHAFGIATTLATNPSIRTILVPGEYDASEAQTIGAYALEFLGRFHADIAVLGASGLFGTGPSDASIDSAAVYGTMARQATQTMIVADHSKFDMAHAGVYAAWPAIGIVITDRAPCGPLAETLARAQVEVRVAD